MRCIKHITDLSSLAGVCATCLRERLSAAQIQLNQSQPSISFPRSVSCRKSDTSAAAKLQFHPQSYSSPQLNKKDSHKSNRGNFSSLLQGIFRSKFDPNSHSWFSTIISKKQFRSFSHGTAKTRRYLNRGMSPARFSDEDENYHGGYSSECSQGWKQTPRTATRRGRGHNRSLSGLAFCLSPLVRPSPNRQRIPPEAGESRVSLSTAASFCKSRSRKLADFGRHYYSTNY